MSCLLMSPGEVVSVELFFRLRYLTKSLGSWLSGSTSLRSIGTSPSRSTSVPWLMWEMCLLEAVGMADDAKIGQPSQPSIYIPASICWLKSWKSYQQLGTWFWSFVERRAWCRGLAGQKFLWLVLFGCKALSLWCHEVSWSPTLRSMMQSTETWMTIQWKSGWLGKICTVRCGWLVQFAIFGFGKFFKIAHVVQVGSTLIWFQFGFHNTLGCSRFCSLNQTTRRCRNLHPLILLLPDFLASCLFKCQACSSKRWRRFCRRRMICKKLCSS